MEDNRRESEREAYYDILGILGFSEEEQAPLLNTGNRKPIDEVEKRNSEFADEIQSKHSNWLRFLVSTISVLFGILVALGDNSQLPRHIRILYSAGSFLLILSILFLSASLYSGLYYSRRKRRLYNEEAGKTLRENRLPQRVYVPRQALFSICEAAGYICFVSALLALGVYMLQKAIL